MLGRLRADLLDAGEDLTASSPPALSAPTGADAFPALDDDFGALSDVRVTGNAAMGEDAEMDQFTSAFPDITSEVPSAAEVRSVLHLLLRSRHHYDD